MRRKFVESVKWLSVMIVSATMAACVSKPSITITPVDKNAVASQGDDSTAVVASSSGPNLDGVSGPKDPDAPTEFTSTPSGLEYRILRKSDGRKPTESDTVSVHYAGWLDDGKEFDSSYKRKEETSFPLNGVIPGWTEGIQLVGEGGMIELKIPSKLGYGPEGRPGTIPPNATLHFRVELLRIQ